MFRQQWEVSGASQERYDLLDLGPSMSQSSDSDTSAASRILVVKFSPGLSVLGNRPQVFKIFQTC